VETVVESDQKSIIVTLTDDGIGLPADWSRPGHFGLRGLAERVERVGGTFSVSNRSDRGVKLTAEIPLGGGQ
jgi:two-component system sensor histidine kinase UhpB